MKKFFTKKTTLGIILALLVIGGGAVFALNNNKTQESQNEAEATESQTDNSTAGSSDDDSPKTDNQQLEEQNQDPGDDERPNDDEPSKNPTQILTKPVVYTGYGHNAKKPLPLSQSTSTTCTTDPKVSCSIRFRNVSTGKVVDFDEKTTDAEGVALWDWEGLDVGSGAWNVTARAGNKVSDKEVIYIK